MSSAYHCPSCKKPVARESEAFPFCSTRCQHVDLGRWFLEDYRISRPVDPEEAEEALDPEVDVEVDPEE